MRGRVKGWNVISVVESIKRQSRGANKFFSRRVVFDEDFLYYIQMAKNNSDFLIKILKGILIAIAVVTPFVVAESLFFPFITGKNFFFRILVEIALAIWLYLILARPEYRPKKSPILFVFAGLIGVMFLANIFGFDFSRSFWSNFERMEGFVGLLHLFMYFIILSSVFKTWSDWRMFLRTSVIASFLMFIFGTIQLACAGVNSGLTSEVSEETTKLCKNFVINQGGVRVDGTLGNAIYLAVYMLFNFFFALLLYFKEKSLGWKISYVISALGSLILIYYTATRGVMLGLFGGFLLLALILAINKNAGKNVRLWARSALITLVVLAVIFVFVRQSSFVRQSQSLTRLADISLESSDAQARLMVWGSAWQGFKERPIFGWGQENFGLVFNKYYNPKMYDREQWFDRAHNAVLDWLLAGGIFSFLLYLSLFYFALRLIWKKREEHDNHPFSVGDKALLTSVLSAYFFQSLFVFDNITSSILLFSVLAMISTLSSSENDDYVFPINRPIVNNENRWLIVGAIAVLAVSLIYFVNYKGYVTAKSLIYAIGPHKKGVEGNLEEFQKAIAYKSFGLQEAREYLLQVSINVTNNQNVSNEIKSRFADLAVSEMKKEADEKSHDPRPGFLLGSLLSIFGQHDLAILELEKTLELAPKKSGILIELATANLRKGDLEEAFRWAEKIYEDAPEVSSLKKIYIVLAIHAGKFNTVGEVFNSLTDEEKADEKILSALAENRKFQEIVSILEIIFNKDKNNKNNGLRLAVAYVELGQKTRAIQIINELIESDPDFKETGESYISEIRNW